MNINRKQNIFVASWCKNGITEHDFGHILVDECVVASKYNMGGYCTRITTGCSTRRLPAPYLAITDGRNHDFNQTRSWKVSVRFLFFWKKVNHVREFDGRWKSVIIIFRKLNHTLCVRISSVRWISNWMCDNFVRNLLALRHVTIIVCVVCTMWRDPPASICYGWEWIGVTWVDRETIKVCDKVGDAGVSFLQYLPFPNIRQIRNLASKLKSRPFINGMTSFSNHKCNRLRGISFTYQREILLRLLYRTRSSPSSYKLHISLSYTHVSNRQKIKPHFKHRKLYLWNARKNNTIKTILHLVLPVKSRFRLIFMTCVQFVLQSLCLLMIRPVRKVSN